MGNFFARQYSAYSRELRRSCETLLGICAGLLADQGLNEQEVLFLDQWLKENDAIADVWPGEMIAQRVRHALADGVVTDDELGSVEGVRNLLGSYSIAPVTRTSCVMGKRNYKDFCIALGDNYGVGEAPKN